MGRSTCFIVYKPVDIDQNPLAFADGLVEAEGAFPKTEGSIYGYEYFTPTEEEWKEIEWANGDYFISSKGRVLSLCNK